jgi:hypothetical protein
MESRERTVIATTTLLSSLAFYKYAKANNKSEVTYLMFGAFVGAVLGELALQKINKAKSL